MSNFELWLKTRQNEIELIPGHKGEPFFKSIEEENAYKERMSKAAEELRQAALDRAAERARADIAPEELLERIQNLELIVKEQAGQIDRLFSLCQTIMGKNTHRDY